MDPVLHIIQGSNQRGGRMLSVIDLLEARTLDRAQLSRLIAHLEAGASWLVGARPGGAGKTTVMSALLGVLPAEGHIALATPGSAWQHSRSGDCVVAYEIGQGPYHAYVWGESVRRLAQLAASGCRVVTNLHADTLTQARKQIVNDNGVPEHLFPAFGIFLPVTFSGRFSSPSRRVKRIDVFHRGQWREIADAPRSPAREAAIARFLDACVKQKIRAVADVRSHWLQWRRQSPPPPAAPQSPNARKDTSPCPKTP